MSAADDLDPANGPCWCGEENPHYDESGLDDGCGGTGVLYCSCGGDLCVCHNHGEVECDGCDDCCEAGDEHDYGDEEDDDADDE